MLRHWQRVIAYLTWCIVIGLALIIFTHKFIVYASVRGSTGYFTLFGFGFALLNLGYIVNRRFVLRSDHTPLLNYGYSLVMLAPTLFWIFTKNTGLGDSLLTFTLTIILGAFLGTFLGIRKGFAKREQYWKDQEYYQHEEEKLPDELKRPHDKLSKN